MATSKLFTPLTLGGKNPIQLKHRVVMVPMGRLRASQDGVPPEITATYYQQRATPGGLQIGEATNIAATARGECYSPGLFTQAQIDGWKRVTSAVHEKEGIIFAQLWHTGRIGHSLNQPDGQLPVSSTSKHPETLDAMKVTVSDGRHLIGPTRALRADEIPELALTYLKAALNAIEAGFDGVEVHSANGYLLEQFLYDEINDRTDEYGGSIENRARIVFEVLDAIVAKVDSSRVGIRLSPFSMAAGQKMTHPVEDVEYLLKKLATYNLAYVHVIEPRGIHAPGPLAPEGGVTPLFRKLYPGVLISASGYDAASAKKAVEDGVTDLVGIGRSFIANPDLVERFRRDAPLNVPNMATLYNGGGNHPGGAEGYIDYPFLEDKQ